MSDITWVPGKQEEALQLIKDVKSDRSETDWMYLTYAAKKGADAQKVTIGGSGTGGVDTLKNHLQDDDIAFCLLRVSDKIDESVTIKFVFINWLGNKVAMMQKARLSVHLGPIKTFFGQVHLDFTCNSHDELTHELIMERVMGNSGSGSKVLDDSGRAGVKTQATQNKGGSQVRSGGGKKDNFGYDPSLPQSIKDVRKDDNTKTWLLASYQEDSSYLEEIASGSGDVSELRGHLRDDQVAYGIIRKLETIDNTTAVKFCYLRWIGPNVARMVKAKIGTHAGDIYALFAPVHVTLDGPDLAEITDDNIMRLIRNASGTAMHVLDTSPHSHPKQEVHRPAAQPKPVQPKPQSNPTKPQPERTNSAAASRPEDKTVIFEDEDGIRAAIKSVRSDSNDVNWVLITYTAPQSKTLKLLGTGSDGLDEMKSHMHDDNIVYGLYRTTEQIDHSLTVKFCFVDWRGTNIHRMQRAVLGTHSGAVRRRFEPFHVDILATTEDEVTEEIIQQKIKNASGTAKHVLD